MTVRSFHKIQPMFDQTVYIDPSAVVIGKVTLGCDVSIWPNASIRGDLLHINIGARTNIQDNSVLHTTAITQDDGYPLTIGNGVTVGHGAILHGCTIGDDVLVGMGAIVLDGAVVESQVMIAAGSVVPPGKTLETGYLYVGSPIKQQRALTEKEKAMIQQNAQNYCDNKRLYQKESDA